MILIINNMPPVSHRKEREIFEEYIRRKNLRHSEQRMQILDVFLKYEKHLTADELYRMVKRKYPSMGTATVYRTLRLLRDSGLCRELKLDDGTTTYEHLYGHDHHDHLICTSCGTLVEAVDPEIEKLQEKLARTHGFKIKSHKLEIYGICRRCRN
jgi:Fur family ferric uptake transcriptional regulator